MTNRKKRIPFFILMVTAILLISFEIDPTIAQTINGAGASFPYPVYSQWAYKYNQITGVKINYQSIGSGGGIRQIQTKTVDFGASDAPLTMEELEKGSMIQFPLIMGGVVPVVNIEGIKPGQLKLDSNALVNLFMGKITKWNDTALKKLNPELKLPDKEVTIVSRADGSGTTWIFTHYLSAVSKEWKEDIGAGKAVSWPVGVGGKGNEGVASYVQRIDGSLGYVEYAYALQNKLAHVLLKNREGVFVSPTIETFRSAAANANWQEAPGLYVVLVDQPGKDSWPITGASFILVHKKQENLTTAQTMLNFFDWCFRHGEDIAVSLHYVPMPNNVFEIVENAWKTQIQHEGKAVW